MCNFGQVITGQTCVSSVLVVSVFAVALIVLPVISPSAQELSVGLSINVIEARCVKKSCVAARETLLQQDTTMGRKRKLAHGVPP